MTKSIKKLILLTCGTLSLNICVYLSNKAQVPENFISVGLLGIMATTCFIAAIGTR